MRIAIKDIRREPEVQLRNGLDMDRVKAMVEFESEGGTLPPVTVVGDDNLLADGHHRMAAAEDSGRVDIEVNRKPGGTPEAIAIALSMNDGAGYLPLTRSQRNAGIKVLLEAGWSLRRIGKETGVHNTTVLNIQQAMKARQSLPKAVSEKLTDTTLARIAVVPVEQQEELATAVATTPGQPLAEPRVREVIKAMKADPTLTPAAAVAAVAPGGMSVPTPISGVAKQVRRRLKAFLAETMTVDGKDYDFWTVLDVLVAHLRTSGMAGDLQADGLADLLADVSVLSDKYASALRSTASIEPVAIGATNGAN